MIDVEKIEKLNYLKEKGIISNEEYLLEKQKILEAKEVIHSEVSDKYIWYLAFSPLVGLVIEQFFAQVLGKDVSELFYITIGLNCLLSYLDSRELIKCGYDEEDVDDSWLIPIYLLKRAKILNESPTYFWVWIVLFALLLFKF